MVHMATFSKNMEVVCHESLPIKEELLSEVIVTGGDYQGWVFKDIPDESAKN